MMTVLAIWSRRQVTPALTAKALNHSRTSSVSNSPILSRGNSTLNTSTGRPEISITTASAFLHRHMDAGIAAYAVHRAERLLHRLAQRDADILGRVMVIDVEVADRP